MSDDIVTQLLEQNDMLQIQLKQKQEIIEKLSRENQSLKSANQNLLKRVAQLETSGRIPESGLNAPARSNDQILKNDQILPWKPAIPGDNEPIRNAQEQKEEESKETNQNSSPAQNKEQVSISYIPQKPELAQVTIQFKQVADPWSDVHIVGEFNSWSPQEMDWKEDLNLFEIIVPMKVGFKHRFCFKVNGERMVDEALQSSKNSIGALTNVIYVPSQNQLPLQAPSLQSLESYHGNKARSSFSIYSPEYQRNESNQSVEPALPQPGNPAPPAQSIFDYKPPQKVEKKKEDQKQESHDNEAKDNEEGKKGPFNLEEAFQRTNILREKIELLNQNLSEAQKGVQNDPSLVTTIEGLTQQREQFAEELQQQEKKIVDELQGKWAFTIAENPIMHEVVGYRGMSGDLVMRRLFDKNGIKMQDGHQRLKFYPELKFMTEFQVLGDEERVVYTGAMDNHQQVLTIKYRVEGDTPGKYECMPVEVHPSHVQLHEYDVSFNKFSRQITQVSSYEDGPVKFKATEIDAECGFIASSIIDIYTAVFMPDVLNVFHLHINDMSDQVPIEAVSLSKDEDIKDHFTFSTDAMGVTLRYKILVRDMQILRVLYNTGSGVQELRFREIRVKEGTNIGIKDQPVVLQLEKVPVGMLTAVDKSRLQSVQVTQGDTKASYALFSKCTLRYPEGLHGEIDALVISEDGMSLVEKQSPLSTNICQCTEGLDQMQQARIASLFEEKDRKEHSALDSLMELLKTALQDFEKLQKEKKTKLEDLEDVYSRLTKGDGELNALLEEIDLSQQEEQQVSRIGNKKEMIKQVVKAAGQALRRLAADIRMRRLRKESHE